MRICMIMSTPLPPLEGIGFYVWNLSRHLTDLGYEVQIITRGEREKRYCEVVDGITIWRPIFLPVYPLHVHLHSIFVDALVKRIAANVDLFHLHTPLVKAPRTAVKTLVTVHSLIKPDATATRVTNPPSLLIKLQAPVSYRLERDLLSRACTLTTVARSVVHDLRLYAVNTQQVTVLANGVDTRVFYPASYNPNQEKPYFFTAGRLAPGKGLEDLLSSAEYVRQRCPNHRFLIAGSGPLEREIRVRIARQKLQDTVILLGHIHSRSQLADLYGNATAYVHPSHHEGLPTVLLEAMARGCPVVATAVGGVPEVVEHERNGLLVPAKAPEQLAEALARLVRNLDFAGQMGAAAARTVQEKYSWGVVSRNYLTQYESLLNGAAS